MNGVFGLFNCFFIKKKKFGQFSELPFSFLFFFFFKVFSLFNFQVC